MAKAMRGLPNDFDLQVGNGPARLGDYLDEGLKPTQVVKFIKPKSSGEEQKTERPERIEGPNQAKSKSEAPKKAPRPPRREVNLSAEAQASFDRIFSFVTKNGPQRDIKGSEVFQALLSVCEGALSALDLTKVPPRGQWGSESARAFPEELAKAFSEALRGKGERASAKKSALKVKKGKK